MANRSGKWKKALIDFKDNVITAAAVEKLLRDDERTRKPLPTLAISSLHLGQIQQMLHLRHVTNDRELEEISPITLPLELVNVLSKVDRAISRSVASEANIRWTLNLLLVYAHHIVASGRPGSGQSLSIQTERQWTFEPVAWDRKKYKLVGRPDYAVWYGPKHEVELNVVVVEAKARKSQNTGLVQALAYMGVVHRLRKEKNKQDCTIYGVACDDTMFHFLKINNNSEWSVVVRVADDREYGHVLGILVSFLRKAAFMSPTHSKESSRQTHGKEGSGDTTGSSMLWETDEDEDEVIAD